jgi:ATP-dependent Lon protease
MDIPIYTSYPVLPLRNTVLFPATAMALSVGRPKSIAALRAAEADRERWIVAVAQKNSVSGGEVHAEDLYRTGVIAKIEKMVGNEADGYQIHVRSAMRFQITNLREQNGYLFADGEVKKDEQDLDHETGAALLESLKTLTTEILELFPADTKQLAELVDGIEDLPLLTNLCAANLGLEVPESQELLETLSVRNRALKLMDHLQSRKDNLQVQNTIRDKMAQRLSKAHRENILREQMRAIRDELGEAEPEEGEKDYRKKIKDAGMSPEAEKTALDELRRLESIGDNSPEAHIIRNYLDLLVAVPWSRSSKAEIDLNAARKILDDEHYGLEKIKKRILQYLAVMKLKKNSAGSILLFVGPPGVGKTSLGQSIAKALGREFVRASLGGVRDDAEIRGHRRTYIGAMPGRIVQSLKRAGTNNPVMVLDELDKLSRSFQGDPASALLEVLDPEQNKNFLDHYLDVPFDLSNVFFIATANTTQTIPGPLLDRMEVVELTGYTTAEKFHIAKNHLIPKQLKEHGMVNEQLEITDEALLRIINYYTREAGVRELQRKIAEILRGSSEEVLLGKKVIVTTADLDLLLGPEPFVHEVAERIVPPGVVTGLAWTPVGGEILFIEASLMSGGGKLTITGQLGDVMKESAQIALSLVRSRLSLYLPNFEFEKKDIHLHVPAGAIPKDGPSAGVAMLTTIASLFSGRSVDPKLAMTGEITLRGAVMPVGGIKEKVIAAHRAGIERLILPKRNEKDLRDVPLEVRNFLKFEFVETIDEVLAIALGFTPVSQRASMERSDLRQPPFAN